MSLFERKRFIGADGHPHDGERPVTIDVVEAIKTARIFGIELSNYSAAVIVEAALGITEEDTNAD